MLKQYDIIVEKGERKLFPLVEYETEDLEMSIDNTFGLMMFLNETLKFGYMESEHIYIIGFDYKGDCSGLYLLNIGKNNEVEIDKRRLSMFLIMSGATQFIMIHNHPNDVLMASKEDMECFFDIKNMGNTVGIDLIASYVITKSGYYNIQTQEKVTFDFDDVF